MLIFDAHLDLAMNAMEWNRDLTQPIADIRKREAGLCDKPDRGRGTVSFSEMRRGAICICVATQIARYVKPSNPLPGWNSPAQAWAQTQAQFAWYRAMEDFGELKLLTDAKSLQEHAAKWERKLANNQSGVSDSPKLPIGYVLTLEGADSLVTLGHLELAYGHGLRAVGPAHYGPGTYAHGTNANGGIGIKGKELLLEMQRLGIILDVTHLCDESFWEAVDVFQGRLWASHSNCRALVPHHRQLSDDQIKFLIGRGAVIGTALDAWMLVPSWVRAKSTPENTGLKLERVVGHIDHVCQVAGTSRHAGIGSDLDGGFGREQCPDDLNTIADLSRLPELLKVRGYKEKDITNILYRNFIEFLNQSWRP